MIPITVIRDGDGPTALLTGGNHGDEYEGPIALFDADARPRPGGDHGRGRSSCPLMNSPAFRAGTRTSPHRPRQPQPQLSRAGPTARRPRRSPTTSTARCCRWPTIVLDFHSGGRTLDFLPFAAAHVLRRQGAGGGLRRRRCEAFDAPYLDGDARDRQPSACSTPPPRRSARSSSRPSSAAAAPRRRARSPSPASGVRNVLIHAGILHGRARGRRRASMLDMPVGRLLHLRRGRRPGRAGGRSRGRGHARRAARADPAGGAHRRRAGRVPRPPRRPADRPALPGARQARRLPRGRGGLTFRVDPNSGRKRVTDK